VALLSRRKCAGVPGLLHVERALVLGAAMAGTLIFLVRGWAGYFPSKITTSGAEYPYRPVDDLDELIAKLEEDEPEFRARMARGRAHLDQARRYLGMSEEEIARKRAARRSFGNVMSGSPR
jgi:hypothetical protein